MASTCSLPSTLAFGPTVPVLLGIYSSRCFIRSEVFQFIRSVATASPRPPPVAAVARLPYHHLRMARIIDDTPWSWCYCLQRSFALIRHNTCPLPHLLLQLHLDATHNLQLIAAASFSHNTVGFTWTLKLGVLEPAPKTPRTPRPNTTYQMKNCSPLQNRPDTRQDNTKVNVLRQKKNHQYPPKRMTS
jgi:hypothetical protein